MAMRQAGEDATVCNSFSTDLESWIAHILKRKIKFGKTKIRKTDDYSATPANFVLKHLVRNVSYFDTVSFVYRNCAVVPLVSICIQRTQTLTAFLCFR